MNKDRNNESVRFRATKTGIGICIDLPRLLLEILDDRTLDTVMEDGKTLRQILEEIVEDPVRDALGDEEHILR